MLKKHKLIFSLLVVSSVIVASLPLHAVENYPYFDPKKDGYWATVERIKQRMEKRDRERRNARLLAFAAISISVIILSLVCWGLST